MIVSFDHAVIAVADLDTAMRDYDALGFTVRYGGEHASGTTHNALICFADGTYLELLAPTGKPAKPGSMDFSPLLRGGEGIVAFAFASDQLDDDAVAMRARGVAVSEVKEGGRLRSDGVALRWKTALIDDAMTPFLIEDITPRRSRVPDDAETTTHANGVRGIRAFEIASVDIAHERERYARMVPSTPETVNDRDVFALGHTRLMLRPSDALRPGDAGQRYTLWLDVPRGISFDPTKTHAAALAVAEE